MLFSLKRSFLATKTALFSSKMRYVDGWPVTDASDVVFILLCYLMFIIKLGPHVMTAKTPFRLWWWLVFYNIVRVLDSALLASKEIAFLYWRFMVSKILDLTDTVYIVLQKKYRRVTCLHVFQRILSFLLAWFCVKYDPSDHWAVLAALNCSVLTVVYFYFLVAMFAPRFARQLWWKNSLTMVQLMQFFVLTFHVTGQSLASSCVLHPVTNWLCLVCVLLIIVVGINYYKWKKGDTKWNSM